MILEQYINENPPNCLVVGSSNKTGLSKWILGSVSEHCLYKCHCPVTVVHNDNVKESL
ncbi:hypothetical protein BDF14DRAFT_1748609, partial [Spinellus fusiger]